MDNTFSFQAVQQFGAPSSSTLGSGLDVSDSDSDGRSPMASSGIYGSPGVWAKIHTIYYRWKKKNPFL